MLRFPRAAFRATWRENRLPLLVYGLFAALLALPTLAAGERLPLRTFTTADGLAHDRVLKIVRDSHGFLWFCTAAGLSRFDGRSFVSYSAEHGLPPYTLTDLLENDDGSYWIATNGAGLVRYDPAATRGSDLTRHGTMTRFSIVPIDREPATNRVNVIYRDRAGRLWAGTDGGLFAMERATPQPVFRRIPLQLASHPDQVLQIWSLLESPEGSLWVGTSAGLIRRTRGGESIRYPVRPARGTDHVWALMLARDGRLWIGHDAGLLVVSSELFEKPPAGAVAAWSRSSHLLTETRVLFLLPSSEGDVWVGADAGLYRFAPDVLKKYSATPGLEGIIAPTLAEDAHGNIWLSTFASGATRIARDGLTTFTRTDGLHHDVIGMIFETRNGQLCAISRGSHINVFDGRRFHAVVPNLPREDRDARTDSYYALALHDRAGEWWIPSGDTLYRFAAVADPALLSSARPRAVYSLGGGPATRGIWRLFEDSRGDVWIARRVPSADVLTRLERATDTLHHYTDRDGLPRSAATTFVEDRSGSIWIGFWDAGLVRHRNGRFQILSAAEGFPDAGVTALHVDRANRLWCATAQGVIRIDDPSAASPRLVRYSTSNGLSDNGVVTIAEDRSGRLYIGTRRGVDRLDPESARIRHLTIDDGLAALETRAAYCDRAGALWFATGRGLSRLVPRPEKMETAPAAFIQSVGIDGISQVLPDLGTRAAGPLKAPSPRSRIEIAFFALFFHPGESVKYQYKLDGLDEWSAPTEQRSVTYPRLSPGTYRFSVRAVRGDGGPGVPPATLTFRIPPPIWVRWWFLAATAAGLALAVHAAYRYRLARILEIERIRTRLAMDLHDDIGSTLSQVAVLSEVARNRVGTDRRLTELLERIAEISRQLVDAMSDVVWAINPERDSLRDLLQRMRRFAGDTLDARNIRFRFDAPAGDVDIRLDATLRREVFLIFKEGVTNLLRYSNCSCAEVGVHVERSSLVLTITDDGVGVNRQPHGNGLGLRNMQSRADRLDADFRFSSAPLGGTALRLSVPLNRVGRHHPGPRGRHTAV